MQLTMPPQRPGALSADEYASIAAFILQSNGAPAGNQPLTAASGVTINAVATGQAPVAAAAPAPGQAAGTRGCARAGGGGQPAAGEERRRRWRRSPSLEK